MHLKEFLKNSHTISNFVHIMPPTVKMTALSFVLVMYLQPFIVIPLTTLTGMQKEGGGGICLCIMVFIF